MDRSERWLALPVPRRLAPPAAGLARRLTRRTGAVILAIYSSGHLGADPGREAARQTGARV